MTKTAELSAEAVAGLLAEFQAALAAHDRRGRGPWSGPYHFARENERIGALLAIIDNTIRTAGLWPEGLQCIGTDQRVALLIALLRAKGDDR